MKNEPIELSKHSIRHDALDKVAYDDMFSQAKGLQCITVEGTLTLKTFGQLALDVFFALYKTNPKLITQDEIAPEYILNREQMSKLMESPSYQELRQYTQLDELGAGLGTKALLEGLLDQLRDDDALKNVAEKINDAIDKQDVASGFHKHSAEFKQAMADARAAMKNVRRLSSSLQSTLRRGIEIAASKATGEVEQAESVSVSWGLNQGEFTRMPYEQKLEIIKVLRCQQKFCDMTKMVGRMRNLAIASRKFKLEQQRVELHSIIHGGDINHVLLQELVMLRKPVLKLEFYRRMMERQLMQYDLTHKDFAGQGPIIALIDTSSSMRKDSREIWAKAVAMGLAEIAAKEKRAFAYALFSSRQNELITDDFQTSQRSPEKILRLVESFIGGGTDFEQPLGWAMDKLKESRFNKADIVMITDGECTVDGEFLFNMRKTKEEKEFRIYSILIGCASHELHRWSDEVWSVNDLLDDYVAKELFNKI